MHVLTAEALHFRVAHGDEQCRRIIKRQGPENNAVAAQR
jgi:hypothetical protein